MVNIIWAFMAMVGIVYAMFNGTMDEVNKAILESANQAVQLSIGLISILVFWLGIMKIAEHAGILKVLTSLLRPLVVRLFPDIPKDHPALGYILSNFTANLFGLGNAATPLGIKAMEQMKKLNGNKDEASRSMITFLAINTAGLTLIPTTVIAIRIQFNSSNPTEIVSTTLVATGLALTSAILLDRYFYYRSQRRKK
ncbi:spore maturation protein A [Compostibacillus humi]|jgi:spore maturation protein A|uniref:Spore maturation protein A n=1 Tax=Compostibacillus humi TaxID=1245525 RepID=A0A8J2ZPB4_9BACI|nr:nucleoside recognition domain-containing protein [Compostibacillus humi]GGH69021.1 spore maturation protein A [Compostibacillus humi]